MHFRIVARVLALSCGILAAGGCQYSPDTAERTIAFNRSVAEAGNQVILLNAVRSSRRNPTYYSRLSTNTATSTVAPALSAAIPWSGGKTVATTVGKNAAHSSVVTTLTRAIPAITTGLTLTEQNQLTLLNLDDQASINGLMTPVPLSVYQYFQSEGFNAEEMMMMFLSSISLTNVQLTQIADLAHNECIHVKARPLNAWCSNFAAGNGQSRLDSCADPADSDDTKIQFVNDPALRFSEEGYKRFECFQRLERALLAVGLHPDSVSTHKVQYIVSMDTVKNNPRVLADVTQQGLEAAITTSGRLAVCKKTDTPLLVLPDEIKKLLGPKDSDATPAIRHSKHKTGQAVIPPPAPLASSGPTGEYSQLGVFNVSNLYGKDDAEYKSLWHAKQPKDCKEAADQKEKDAGAPPKPDDPPAIAFNQRSVEAMVYYIGQIIRRRVELRDMSKVTYLNGADPGNPYEEELFRIRTGDPDAGAVVDVTNDGKGYFVPDLCAKDDNDKDASDLGCSAEYPNHASVQVLTLLNQVWGLQKTATAPPTVANVTLISPP